MAQYGYSTPYHGIAGGALPQGYMEAATAPGRMLGQGIASLGQNIQAGINQYLQNRDQENYLNAKIDAGLAQYAQAAAQSGGTMPNGDSASVEQAAKIIGEKNAKKLFEGTASRAEKLSIAHALETYGQTQLQALQRNQAEFALNQARKTALGEQELGSALQTILGMQPGTQPTVPYRSVTSEMLNKYQNLTPSQQMTLSSLIQQKTQPTPEQIASRLGLVPTSVSTGEKGVPEIKFEKPVSTDVTSIPIPGTNKVQPVIGGKAFGAPIEKQPEIAAEIDKLPEEKQKWANDTFAKLRDNKAFVDFNTRTDALAQVQSLAGSKNPSPADDIALIIRFNKVMDPAGAVLEGEFKRSVESGSVPERVRQYYEYATSGNQLTDKMRKDIVSSAQSVVNGSLKNVSQLIDNEVKAANYRGIPIEAVIPNSMLNVWKSKSQGAAGSQDLSRFQSVQEAEAAMKPGDRAMVLNPQTRRYQEYIKQ